MPKVTPSSTACRSRTITVILLLSEIILSPCSYCTKEGLAYIALASPLSRQLSFYSEYTKANVCLSYDVRFISNAKYTRPIILNSL